MNEKYDNDCWEYLMMSADTLMDHYFERGQSDILIRDFDSGEVRQYKNTRYHYMVVECHRSPGLRLAGIWDGESDI